MILITGYPGQDAQILALACGSLGIETCVITRREDNYTRTISELARNISANRVHVLHSDDVEKGGIKELIRLQGIKAIFHLAALSNPAVCEQKPIRAYLSNVTLTEEILNAVLESSGNVRVAIASSIYVKSTEDCQNKGIEEASKESTSGGIYVITKKMCSEMLTIYRKAGLMACSQFFLGNHESSIRKNEFIIPTLIEKIRDGEDSLEIRRPYVVRDWQDATITLAQMVLSLSRAAGRDFVIGSGNSYSIADIANKLAHINRKQIIYTKPYDESERDVVYINPSAIEKLTEISGNDESIIKMLVHMNLYWGKSDHTKSMRWAVQSPGWEGLLDALRELKVKCL